MTKHETDPEILVRAHKFAKQWSAYHTKPSDVRIIGNDLMVSASACYERTRDMGGATVERNDYLRRRLDEFRDKKLASESTQDDLAKIRQSGTLYHN